MSTQYRHKTTGRLATLHGIQPEKLYDIEGQVKGYMIGTVPAWMIEDSCDWEKIGEEFNRFVTRDQVWITDPYSLVFTCTEDGRYPDQRLAKYQKGNNLVAFSTSSARDAYIKLFNPPKVILTTEDGVDITDPKQLIYVCEICGNWDKSCSQADVFNGHFYSGRRYFASEAKRDEYILMNKPLLTVKELNDAVVGIFNSCNFSGKNNKEIHIYVNKLISLAKSKL